MTEKESLIMSIMGIANIIAVVLSPLIAVWISQLLQIRSEKRKDKMQVFMTLMRTRAFAWNMDIVNALNVIDVVFSDDKDVRDAWKNHYYALCVSEPKQNELKRIQETKYKLLEVMAKSLGYRDDINWEIIQSPYYPKGLDNQMTMNQYSQEMQATLLKQFSEALSANQNKKTED